jgi:co-chaperonin GroES (HSP10)
MGSTVIRPLKDGVLAELKGLGQRKTAGGIILNAEDGKEHGIRPRWAQVRFVGPEQKDVVPGDWILIAHGRWSREIKLSDEFEKLVNVDVKEILIVSDEEPVEF